MHLSKYIDMILFSLIANDIFNLYSKTITSEEKKIINAKNTINLRFIEWKIKEYICTYQEHKYVLTTLAFSSKMK